MRVMVTIVTYRCFQDREQQLPDAVWHLGVAPTPAVADVWVEDWRRLERPQDVWYTRREQIGLVVIHRRPVEDA